MKRYDTLSIEQLKDELKVLEESYAAYKLLGLKLDMSRGKPNSDQLDLCDGILNVIKDGNDCIVDGFDVRNYGLLEGLPCAKKLFADLLDLKPENIFVGGNSSLNMMYDAVAKAMTHGVTDAEKPWSECKKRKFLCVVPGYDRHFAITEFFGFEHICVPMTPNGPDMDIVEKLVADDEDIKGIWCVPKYSNPDGTVYSEATIQRLAALRPKAKDFRIFYDNAYVVHHLTQDEIEIPNIFDIAEQYGNEDMIFEFASTSKISYPGAGISCIAASKANISHIKSQIFYQTISADKVNQLRHVLYFQDLNGIKNHMRKLADVLKPKFDLVVNKLNAQLHGLNIGSWLEPKGGYFVSFDAPCGCAKRIVALAKEAGITMTAAGSTYPNMKDPSDSNIRIAPTYPPISELGTAMDVFCVCVKIAAIEKLIADKE